MNMSSKWFRGFLALLVLTSVCYNPYAVTTVHADPGGAQVSTSSGLAADDSAQLRAEIMQYDTNNQVVQKGFEVWPASAGPIPPADPQTLLLGGGMDSLFYGYATGLTENTEYYFRAFAETQDGQINYGDSATVTTATYSAMNGEKWIVGTVPFQQLELENGTPTTDVAWPTEVEVIFTDGSHKKFPVDWEEQYRYEWIREDGGNDSFPGQLKLPDGSKEVTHPFLSGDLLINLSISVKQSNMVSVDALSPITVPVGATLQQIQQKLPKKVGVTLENGNRETAYPQWDSGAPSFVYGTVGTYTFTGEIGPGDPPLRNDDGLTATVVVQVVPYLWQLVGSAGFTPDKGESVSFIFDSAGVPYVAFKDSAHNGAASVMKYDGASWSYVGAQGFSTGTADSLSLAYDADEDTIYVAYADGNRSGAVSVRKFDAKLNKWPLVGTAGFSGGSSKHISLAVDSWEHKPYVAYADGSSQGKASVMSFNGTAWEALGALGFSSEAVRAVSLSVNYGTLMLTYEAAAAPHAAAAWVWEYYNPQWAAQDQPAASSAYLIHADGGGQKYAVYEDELGVQYKEYYYGSWNSGSTAAMTDKPVHALDLVMVKSDKYSHSPYAAYTDSTDSDKVTVKTLDKGDWLTVGSPAFTAGAAQELKLQVYEGTPYVAIKDGAQNGRLTVLKFAPVLQTGVQTVAVENIRTTAASVSGAAADAGNSSIMERGIVYSTSPNSTVSGYKKAVAGSGSGSYKAELTALLPGTKYYARAYILTLEGVIYGGELSFTTSSDSSGSSLPPAAETEGPALTVTVREGSSGTAKPADKKITEFIGKSLDMTATLMSLQGTPLSMPAFTVKNGDSFRLPNVPAGQYKMLLNVVAPTGEKLAGTMAKLTVSSDGSAAIDAELIDPYGIITDSVTGKPVDGVKVTLHWMDTELNKAKGRKPHELVKLPILPDFTPNQNEDPQYSRDGGKYGWMVFPEGDYYILAEKEGYQLFDSRNDGHEAAFGDDSYIRDGNIHVGQSIVEYSFEIDPKVKSTGQHEPYMRGYPDGSFLPESGITRAELAAILNRTMVHDPSKSSRADFADVSSTHWSAADIQASFENGWLQGYPDGTFKPEQKVTRAELAQVLARVNGWTQANNGQARFSDLHGHWSAAAVMTAVDNGLLAGYEDGSYKPDQAISRVETVRIFNKLLGRRPEALGIEPYWPDVPKEHWGFIDIMEASLAHNYSMYETGSEVWKP